jgi:hypothetical protein
MRDTRHTSATAAHDETYTRTLSLGAAAGTVTTVLFIALHGALISTIWAMVVPMAISGGLCGLSIAWSYKKVADPSSMPHRFALNAAYLATLLALGVVSVALYEPEWALAELIVENPLLGDLFSRVVPLMVVYAIGASLAVWAAFGRVRSSLLPILVSEVLLVVLLGNNVAIIGLVDIPAGSWYLVVEMLGLVAFLGITYSVAFPVLDRLSSPSLVEYADGSR